MLFDGFVGIEFRAIFYIYVQIFLALRKWGIRDEKDPPDIRQTDLYLN